MKQKILLMTLSAGTVFVIEEIRAYRFLREAERRFNDQNIRLASLVEQVELLRALRAGR